MYLLDGGLWSACKESRLVMESVYRPKYWSKMSYEIMHPIYAESDKHRSGVKYNDQIPTTAYFIPHADDSECTTSASASSQNSHAWFFTVYPGRDLFILPLDSLVYNWHGISEGGPLSLLYSGHTGLLNIGIEFDPWWNYARGGTPDYDSYDPLIFDTLYDLAKEIHERGCYDEGTIWFIDHRLKRRPTSGAEGAMNEPKGEDGEVVFYAMDRKYTAVSRNWGEHGYGYGVAWETHDLSQDEHDQGSDQMKLWTTCADFIYGLESYIEDFHRSVENHATSDTDYEAIDMVTFGVLACEYL